MRRTSHGICRRAIVWIGLVGALVCATPAAPLRLAPEPVDPGDPIWDDLWRLELSGALPAGTTADRSATRGEIAEWIAAIAPDRGADPHSYARARRAFARELRRLGAATAGRETGPALRLTGPACADSAALDGVRSEIRLGPSASFQARVADADAEIGDSTRAGIYGVAAFGRHLCLSGEIFAGEIEDGRDFGDPLVAGTDILYFSEHLEAALAGEDARLRLARGRHHWGAGSGSSLLLDRSAAPIGFVEWNLDLPAGMRFRSWTGSLSAAGGQGIAAHRLEIPLSRDLRVNLSEGVRFDGAPTRILYLLGIVPYTLVQRFDWQDAGDGADRERLRNNVLADIEVVWRPARGHLAHAEILVDDLPAAKADMPARVGGRLGWSAALSAAGRPADLRVEGAKVGRYVYSVDYGDGCDCDWIHQDRAMGHPAGPDQERLEIEAGISWNRDHRVSLSGLYANRGAGELGEAWTGQDGEGDLTRRALRVSGPVTRERGVGVAWRYEPRDNLALQTGASLRWVKDPTRGADYAPASRIELRAAWRL